MNRIQAYTGSTRLPALEPIHRGSYLRFGFTLSLRTNVHGRSPIKIASPHRIRRASLEPDRRANLRWKLSFRDHHTLRPTPPWRAAQRTTPRRIDGGGEQVIRGCRHHLRQAEAGLYQSCPCTFVQHFQRCLPIYAYIRKCGAATGRGGAGKSGGSGSKALSDAWYEYTF